MKLKNKLLPFVGIAALGATFAPIALTSCKSGSTNGAIDLREWYTPTIEKHAYTALTEDEAASLYFCGDETAEWGDWMDEDEMNERLTQDYLFGSSMWVQSINGNVRKVPAKQVGRAISKLPTDQAEFVYQELMGVPFASMNADAAAKEDAFESHYTYNKYDVILSDVRIGHMTNYYNPLLPVEYPTISFQLEFDIDFEGEVKADTKSGQGVGMYFEDLNENWRLVDFGSSYQKTNHKGSLTVVNVPVKIEYQDCSEIGTKTWTVKFDYETLEETELSTKVPFGIYGTDNVSYVTDAEIDGSNEHYSSVESYNFDYYSNMIWEKFVNDKDVLTKADKAYDDAISSGKTRAEAKEAKDEVLIEDGHAVKTFITYMNKQFFETASYYLISVACK